MDMIKKHVDLVVILTAFAGALLWLNSHFNHIDRNFAKLEKEIAIIKTVLVMKNIMPNELAKVEDVKR